MAAEASVMSARHSHHHFGGLSSQPLSPMNQANPFDTSPGLPAYPIGSERNGGRPDSEILSAIYMRKLPRNTSNETLRSMLLFAKDFVGADFVPTEHTEDQGYLSAIARFRTSTAAYEARAMLDGKPNTANEARMIVEVLHMSPDAGRRNTFDWTNGRTLTTTNGSSTGQPTRQTSRFNGTFQSIDRISPPSGAVVNGASTNGELPTPDVTPQFPHFFAPQSPIGPSAGDRQRLSGKAMIGEDGVDDETGELLKDPVAYAKNDISSSMNQSRRITNPQLSTSRFAGLSLSTSNMVSPNAVTSPSMQGFTSPRTNAPLQSPTGAMSPTGMGNLGPNASYQMANQHYQRHNYPPVNPADKNPPCNTLYVGNLPIDTSEDELKAMFCKQRGYKRLCFRTKQNGPMCFVEFEDVSFATKALNELYGHPLHNSVKGGIRLSFSKNPLGVRTGQPGGMGPPTPMSPGPLSGINGLGLQSFSTAHGPPPGLSAPPGLSSPGANSAAMNGLGSPVGGSVMGGYFGSANIPSTVAGMSGIRSPSLIGNPMVSAAGGPWNGQGPFPDYMLGR